MFVTLAVRFNWTPEQVLGFDPHFLDELMSFLSAESDYLKIEQKRLKKEIG